jgi:hypothetical protein
MFGNVILRGVLQLTDAMRWSGVVEYREVEQK